MTRSWTTSSSSAGETLNCVLARLLGLALSAGIVVLMAACATAPTSTAMEPTAPAVVRATLPGTVAVSVTGGSETSAYDSPNISNADFKEAVVASLLKARAFEGVAADAATRYTLGANIVSLNKPVFGLTFTVELEVAWSLTDRHDGRVLLRKAIASSGTAGVSDAFAGVTRLRLAVEAAARSNIEQMLRGLAAHGG